MPSLLRNLPSVDRILDRAEAAVWAERFGRSVVRDAIRECLGDLRTAVREGRCSEIPSDADLLADVERRLGRLHRLGLRRVINATGVILHTGLGRAVLASEVLDAIRREHAGYSLLEVGEEGGRCRRERHVEDLLRRLTGAPAALCVNNNAAATLLAVAALAAGGEVVVSRGQLVEIGGQFRVPEVLAQGGARLVEVGTTNRTYVADFAAAISPRTAMLLRVHTSNFRQVGFTAEAPLPDLVDLGRRHGVPVVDDLGSGALFDLSAEGFAEEPTVRDSLAAGTDLVCFSGDKLLGGPQAGIVLGRTDLVQRLRSHPLFRAFRPDKLCLTALEATLALHLDPSRLAQRLPTVEMIRRTPADLSRAARRLARRLAAITGVTVEVVPATSEIGGGSVPGQELPTWAVSVHVRGRGAQDLAHRLRHAEPPVFPRVHQDRVLLDVRTLRRGEDRELTAVVAGIAGGTET